MRIFEAFLLLGLIICALATSFTKKLLPSIIIYMSYSSIMAIIWVILQSPDLAITEAAVGAGVTSILFFVTLKKIHAISDEPEKLTMSKEEAYGSDEEPESPEGGEVSDGKA